MEDCCLVFFFSSLFDLMCVDQGWPIEVTRRVK